MARLMRKSRQKGTALFLGTLSLVFIIPMVGLVIDVGILYSAKSRMQASVDGAALAAARALNVGQSTAAQATSAKQNAVNWFYANFPTGNWSTTNTLMDTTDTHVHVYDDPSNPNLRRVDVTATTTVPTWFMRWFNIDSTTITVNGNASRRDVVAMLVLDRSGSMCTVGGITHQPCSKANSTYPCRAMIDAAKIFTGQFAAQRDRIGMVTFSSGSYVDHAPDVNFQTQLGYTNGFGSANGLIDQLVCQGGTGTAEAISLAYNELYKQALSGALNILVLETDGLPNTGVYNFWDGANAGIRPGSNCQDSAGLTWNGGGWRTAGSMRNWQAGYSMNTGGTGYMSDIPAGAIGSFYSSDPGSKSFTVLYNPWQLQSNNGSGNDRYLSAPGCRFNNTTNGNDSDLLWIPSTDVFGNQVNPANAFQSVTVTGGHIALGNNTPNADWANVHGAALNLVDNAAYRARTNPTLPVYVFAVGLGGNGGPPDPILLQRVANDPNGDQFNSPATYQPCANETGCITYSNQPQGTFVYAQDMSTLGQAFLRISSQILRLSR
jgi:Flp pilus assembly protein TadG